MQAEEDDGDIGTDNEETSDAEIDGRKQSASPTV